MLFVLLFRMAGKGRDFAKPWRGSMEAPEQGELRGDGRAGGARGSWSVAAEPPLWEVSQSFRRLGAWPILLPAPPEVEPSVVSPAMSRLRPRTVREGPARRLSPWRRGSHATGGRGGRCHRCRHRRLPRRVAPPLAGETRIEKMGKELERREGRRVGFR